MRIILRIYFSTNYVEPISDSGPNGFSVEPITSALQCWKGLRMNYKKMKYRIVTFLRGERMDCFLVKDFINFSVFQLKNVCFSCPILTKKHPIKEMCTVRVCRPCPTGVPPVPAFEIPETDISPKADVEWCVCGEEGWLMTRKWANEGRVVKSKVSNRKAIVRCIVGNDW